MRRGSTVLPRPKCVGLQPGPRRHFKRILVRSGYLLADSSACSLSPLSFWWTIRNMKTFTFNGAPVGAVAILLALFSSMGGCVPLPALAQELLLSPC